jgi:molecular chaperone GrpE (heat shock protein)
MLLFDDLVLQEQLSLKNNSLSDTSNEIDRLNQEIARLDRISNEKTEEIQRLTTDLDNYKRDNESTRVCTDD